jgi:hypothetical protein
MNALLRRTNETRRPWLEDYGVLRVGELRIESRHPLGDRRAQMGQRPAYAADDAGKPSNCPASGAVGRLTICSGERLIGPSGSPAWLGGGRAHIRVSTPAASAGR